MKEKNFPVVCVGGSAGGLDAFIDFLQNIPSDTGVAVVIVNHLREHVTRLHEILPSHTEMPVMLIKDQLVIEPNTVYIIPENRDLHIREGEFRLEPISKPYGWPDVISVFLKSMADNWKGKLIAVIVSGLDGDGAKEMCKIKEEGGITFAQDKTAKESDMPQSAIDTGCVDFILPLKDIAKVIELMAKSEKAKRTKFRVRDN